MTGEGRLPEPPEPDNIPGAALSRLSPSQYQDLLRQVGPDKLLEIAENYSIRIDERETERLKLESKKEDHRHEEEMGRQRLAITGLIIAVIIVISSFFYSGITEDKSISEKVLNILLGVLGGGGAVTVLTKNGKTGKE
ncbi:MAG: hypothetical protein F6K11_26310 [Leptolyngbya sp. SIO3F4]|nr:hypothetical protein [Leptolyngbya sp. SIO3F4]